MIRSRAFIKLIPSILLSTIPFVGFFVLGWDILAVAFLYVVELLFFLVQIFLVIRTLPVNRERYLRDFILMLLIGTPVAVLYILYFFEKPIALGGWLFFANLALLIVEKLRPSSRIRLRQGMFLPTSLLGAELIVRVMWIAWLFFMTEFSLAPMFKAERDLLANMQLIVSLTMIFILYTVVRTLMDFYLMTEREKAK